MGSDNVMKNGDKVIIKEGMFMGLLGTLYIDDNGNYEVYIPENKYHSGFYIYCTEEDLIKDNF